MNPEPDDNNKDLAGADFWGRTRGERDAPRRAAGLLDRLRLLVDYKRARVLGRLVDSAGPGPVRVLELGCAPGEMLLRLDGVRPGQVLCGIDYSESGVLATREALSRSGVAATIYCGDIRTFESPDKFDLVVSFGLIEHYTDVPEVLRSHIRFAKPGGVVGVTFPNFASAPTRVPFAAFMPVDFATHNLKIMNRAALREAMQAAGLEDVVVGAAGGPKVWAPDAAGRTSAGAWALWAATRPWNLVAALLPAGGLLWDTLFWGLGRTPRAPRRET